MANKKQKTNVQFVKQIMEFSRHGALKQVFVMQALEQFALSVASKTPEQLDTPMVAGAAWHGCATELLRELSEHYGREIKADKS